MRTGDSDVLRCALQALTWLLLCTASAGADEARTASTPSLERALEAVLADPLFRHRDPAGWHKLDGERAPKEEPPPADLPKRTDSGAAGAWSGFTVFALVLAGGVALLGLGLGLRALRARRPRHRTTALARVEENPASAPSALDNTPEGWTAAAQTLAAAGRYQDAARALFLSLVARLHRAGLVDYDAALTNGELVRGLHASADVRAGFARFSAAFDSIAYGDAPLDAARYARFADDARTLAQEAQQTTPTAGSA